MCHMDRCDDRSTLANNGSFAFSLGGLFMTITACCCFFAVMRLSPLLAIVMTLWLAPSFLRTSIAAEMYEKSQTTFGWQTRIRQFLLALLIVAANYVGVIGTFVAVSLLIGFFCSLIVMVDGSYDLIFDIGIMGSVIGMVWGFAASIVAASYLAKMTWMPRVWKP